MKRLTAALQGLGQLVRRIDPADGLLFAGLASLTAAAGLVHVGLALLVFGLGTFYLGLAAGRGARK
jgi:hypothetical protein